MPLYELTCTECAHEWEEISTFDGRVELKCPLCGGINKRRLSTFAHWSPSRERTAKQLKRRSLEHTKRTVQNHGVDALKQNETFRNIDEEWRNKTRSKVQGKNVIEKFENVHKDWDPGVSRYDNPNPPQRRKLSG